MGIFMPRMPKLRSAYERIRLHGWEGAARLLRDNLFATARCLRLKLELPSSDWLEISNQQPPSELHVMTGNIAELEKLRAVEIPGGWSEDYYCDKTHGLQRFYLGLWSGTLAHISWFAPSGDATTVSNWRPAATELEIRNVHTQEAFRGRGIFQQVARVALREMQSQGITTVYAHVNAGNVASLKGLSRLGFVPVEEVLIRRILGMDSIRTRPITTLTSSYEWASVIGCWSVEV